MTFPQIKIGSVRLENFCIFAPLAGISDLPMRLLARQAGCAMVCSEMISANGLVYGSKKTRRLLDSDPAERPISVQIFGADPLIMADAARIVEDADADILDINFGCSVKKVLKTGAGAALMKSRQQAESVMLAVRKAVRIPVTVKLRSGWENSGRDALDMAEIAEAAGIDAIAIHPRTASQGFRGKADWSLIKKLKDRVSVPVIGNGDVVSARDALKMKDETGCDAVMIGRAAVGNPWIFSQIMALIKGDEPLQVNARTRIDTMRRYLDAGIACYGETHACYIMRSRLGWFARGLPCASQFRESIKRISSATEAQTCLDAYERSLVQP